MANKTNSGRNRRKPVQRTDKVEISLSRDEKLLISVPPLLMIQAIAEKAIAEHPLPDPPYREIETATGVSKVAIDDDPDWINTQKQNLVMRNDFVQDYAYNHFVHVVGYTDFDTEEENADGEARLIEKYRSFLDHFKALSPSWIEGLSDYQIILRGVLVTDGLDFAAVSGAIFSAFDMEDITQEDIRNRARFR